MKDDVWSTFGVRLRGRDGLLPDITIPAIHTFLGELSSAVDVFTCNGRLRTHGVYTYNTAVLT